jgi:transposase-like protein
MWEIRDGDVVNRPIYVALAVTCEGTRDILGLWAGEHGDGEGYGTSTCSFPPIRAAA